MKAYRVVEPALIAPFARTANDCVIGTQTLGSARRQVLAQSGCVLDAAGDAAVVGADDVVTGPALLLRDDVWLTRRCLRSFLSATKRHTTPQRLALPNCRLLALTLPLQDAPVDDDGSVAFDVVFVPRGCALRAAEAFSLGRAQWCVVPHREMLLRVPQPKYILGSDDATLSWPLTSSICMRVRHWLHVLRAGHFFPQVELIERALRSPVRSSLRALMAVSLSRARMNQRLRQRFVFRGHDVFVHPTATVEASVLEPGVRIGAHALVQNSVIGAGSVIEQRAHVSGSVLGPRTFVSLNSTLVACVTFGDADVCINGVQACVFAEQCAVTSFAHPLDLSVRGEVMVKDGDAMRGAGALPCGSAFGRGVFLGANVTVAPGRAIPAFVRLLQDPATVLGRVPDAAGTYAVRLGAGAALSS